MPFLVKLIVLELICIGVCLVGAFVVDTVKGVRARFILFGFEIRGVSLEISLTVPGEVVVVFSLMGIIAF